MEGFAKNVYLPREHSWAFNNAPIKKRKEKKYQAELLSLWTQGGGIIPPPCMDVDFYMRSIFITDLLSQSLSSVFRLLKVQHTQHGPHVYKIIFEILVYFL